ncbi:CaiB/BaiF CoA transferase family protein [Pollutimonas bauzanensis]|uniref:Crotonobetainyl-CoA:carnitine CoA-transferase CaiB n=1 Tax=Pollutimonas bauzanensis TaxID=658167 RepID=A0A1M5Z9C1_9BURK|nr:CoA transferase [Pollutimonas bauzanensis]SHI20782.1 Crotonobetainyl-CoA:carnitine CoA-transferase CaiB [Pollutimonas bauzanensis]
MKPQTSSFDKTGDTHPPAGGPLSGVRVLDLTSIAMGPLATQMLGDMGADVIKVESPQGDAFRYSAGGRSPGMSSTFLNFNRNKRSVVLDLKDAKGVDELLSMVKLADVLVHSLRPKAMRKLRLDYDRLQALNQRLVYCGAYGFSEKGPYAGRAAYDDIIQAMSGMASIQADPRSGEPAYVKSIIADKISGLTVVNAIVMALFERELSGMGQAIEVPMFETMAAFNLLEHMTGEVFSPPNGEMGYARLLSTQRRPYRTSNGHIALMPYTTRQWRRFFTVAGHPEISDQERVTDAAVRNREIDALYELLARIVAAKSTEQWLALLADEDIPHAAVNTLPDLLDDEHLRAVGLFQPVRHETEGDMKALGIPVAFSRTPGSIRRLAPALGSHSSAEVLASWNVHG